MRRALLVGVALLALALAPSGDTARADDSYQVTLKALRDNVTDSQKLELDALHLATHGNPLGAHGEIEDSIDLLKKALPAAVKLTPPADLSKWIPDNSWEHLSRNLKHVIFDDEEVLTKPKQVDYWLTKGIQEKSDILHLVNGAIKQPECSVVIDHRGPITVNGVAQGSGTLTVYASCRAAMKALFFDVPKNTVTEVDPEGSAKAAAMKSAHVVEVDMNGKAGGATIKGMPDFNAGLPVDVVPIVGDSVTYVAEVM